jgi:hypothetical protein
MIKLYISESAANILLKSARDPSFLIDRDDWDQADVEDICWALSSRDDANRLTLSAKQFDWFCSEADWAICEAHG